MKIILNNNTSTLVAPVKVLLKVKNHAYFKARAPGAFFSEAFRKRRWDGNIYFMTDAGVFQTGKLAHMLEVLEDLEDDLEFVDHRAMPIKAGPIPQKLNEIKLRKYQFNAVKAIKYNKIYGVPMPRGILDMATNAGKTIVAAAIFQTYNSPTAFYVKSKELFTQAIGDLKKFLPGRVGHLSATTGEHWNDFMVIMVPSIVKKLSKYGPKLAKFNVIIVDECDESIAKGFKAVLSYTYNAYIKIGLSGSVFSDKRAAKKIKNESVRASFGEVLFKIGNTDLIEKGFSSDVQVTVHQGNTKHNYPNDYTKEYLNGIILSRERNGKIMSIAMEAISKALSPMLIMIKNHKHIVKLMKVFEFVKTLPDPLTIDWVHHERKDRDDVVDRFTKGEVDILIGSYILKRGKNFPLMKTIINAGGGDSMENVLQILGRATRKSETKTITQVHDFWDKGSYLSRHSYHRVIVYKNEGLKLKKEYTR